MKKPKADEYERIMQVILQQKTDGLSLGKDIIVKRDMKMRGLSGFDHQIDVAFTCEILGVELIFIVECKCYKRKVSVEDVLTFMTRINDIRAHKGIFVTTEGYQKGALQVARKNRIALVTVRGTKWRRVKRGGPVRDYVLAQGRLEELIENFTERQGELPPDVKTGVSSGKRRLRSGQRERDRTYYYFFFKRHNQEVRFSATELCPDSQHLPCKYREGGPIAFLKADNKDIIPTECLLKFLVCQELCGGAAASRG